MGGAHGAVNLSYTCAPAKEFAMSTSTSVIVEIRAAEGGDDAKSLVEEQLALYAKRALRDGL
jgi:hypothetical protein